MIASQTQLDAASAVLASLGHPTRISIYMFLQGFGSDGANVGTIKAAVQVPDSTLSHHLERLKNAGIVGARRQERFVYYWVMPRLSDSLSDFLKQLLIAAKDAPAGQ